MKNLSIVAAVGKNNELGCANDLIWRIREDLQFFRTATMGHYVVMGLRTYHSLPPSLPGRRYIVISETPIKDPAVLTFSNLESFIQFTQNCNEHIWVIGGGMIYTQLLPYSGKMVLTEIDAEAPNADVYFPRFDKSEWEVQLGEEQVSEAGVRYRRNTYARRQVK
jgi:dihydrofolate reductase